MTTFIGKAGQLLDSILAGINFDRNAIYTSVEDSDWQGEPESNKTKCHKWHLHCDACHARRCPLDYIDNDE